MVPSMWGSVSGTFHMSWMRLRVLCGRHLYHVRVADMSRFLGRPKGRSIRTTTIEWLLRCHVIYLVFWVGQAYLEFHIYSLTAISTPTSTLPRRLPCVLSIPPLALFGRIPQNHLEYTESLCSFRPIESGYHLCPDPALKNPAMVSQAWAGLRLYKDLGIPD